MIWFFVFPHFGHFFHASSVIFFIFPILSQNLYFGHSHPLFPYGKRLESLCQLDLYKVISIHSSHTGRDTAAEAAGPLRAISIHSSQTGRDIDRDKLLEDMPISIHSSHTGRDDYLLVLIDAAEISIHSSHTGRDRFPPLALGPPGNFNPLFPYGKRRRCTAP